MKKLMFAAAVAASMVAFGDITSQNVVGYQNKTVSLFQFIGPDFIQCDGTEDLTLGQLQFNCDETSMTPATGWMPMFDFVNVLDESGNCPEQLVYVNQAYVDELSQYVGPFEKGWYESVAAGNLDFSNPRNSEPIEFGKAIQVSVQSGHTDAGLTFSGQVKKDPTITDVALFVTVANCSPADICLSNVVVNCDETSMTPATGWMPMFDFYNVIDESGNCPEQLVYVNQAYVDELSQYVEPFEKGWYESVAAGNLDFSDPRGGTVIKAGDGFQVSIQAGTDATVQINPAL